MPIVPKTITMKNTLNNVNNALTESAINLEVARTWCENWYFHYQEWHNDPDNHALRGFWIPIDDLIRLKEYGACSARAYLAMEDPNTNKIKIVLVPVDSDGKDMILPISTVEPPLYSIYDYTKPCPDQCHVDSPLYVTHPDMFPPASPWQHPDPYPPCLQDETLKK